MPSLEVWRLDAGAFWDRLMSGLDLFGPYAAWLWVIPAAWAVTAISLWLFMMRQQRKADRAYLTYASRNLSLLRRLAKQRAREVSYGRQHDHW
jgi:hypothetical protein